MARGTTRKGGGDGGKKEEVRKPSKTITSDPFAANGRKMDHEIVRAAGAWRTNARANAGRITFAAALVVALFLWVLPHIQLLRTLITNF